MRVGSRGKEAFVSFQTFVANRVVIEHPLVEKLGNINICNIVEGCFSRVLFSFKASFKICEPIFCKNKTFLFNKKVYFWVVCRYFGNI